MSSRESARAEAKFLRGETGVDGQATEETVAPEVKEQDDAREQVLRGGTFLGRELLTWLLWRSESGDPVAEVDGEKLVVLFTGRTVLRGVSGDVTEVVVRGAMAPYSLLVKETLARGLLVHAARLRFTVGERAFEATVDAEHFDVRAGKLPQLLAEDEHERIAERLELSEKLSRMLDVLIAAFLEVRASPAWKKRVVPQLREWMAAEASRAARDA